MSTFNEIDVTCEECEEQFTGTIWTAIHAREDPELKDILLGGELNILTCPKCSYTAYRDHFVLYQDPAAELIAYIYPPDQAAEADFLRETILTSFHEAQKVYPPKERKDYEPTLVFGLETFVEMMHAEESRAEQSQIAEAICRERKISYTLLRPSRARSRRLLRVLPVHGDARQADRQSILAGLEELLTINPALDLYAGLRSAIQKNTDWTVPV